MKKGLFFLGFPLVLSICLGCNEAPKQIDNSKYHTKLDTVTIKTDNDIIQHFEKNKFNKIVDDHPEFFEKIILDPDRAYDSYGSDFGSEVGQNHYYILYAYFLKQRNGDEKYAGPRKKLIEIYSNINSIYQGIAYGGTYFAHQYARIPGYAEYSLYLNTLDEDSKDGYDISRQKNLYIQALRQLIEDENSIDFESMGQQKLDRIKKMNALVDEINQIITNSYYLRCAQHFQYEHY